MLKDVKALIEGFLTVFKHLFKKPVTLEYPKKKKQNLNFRGKPIVKGCIKCGTCLKVCPTGAIKIEENNFKIDLNKCIFCGNCMYYCPKGAIVLTNEYELGTTDKNDLELNYEGGKND